MLKPLVHALGALDAELPARPRTLVQLLSLLQDESCTLSDVSALVESDMTLSAALLRTVNSAMFGLLRRVQTVGEAVRYLGMREVAAITFETALRNAFAPTPDMERLWQRASVTGLLMGRAATCLKLDAMLTHTAGLFERCGQAVLLDKAKSVYTPLMHVHGRDRLSLHADEQEKLGITHAALGSALCASWGMANGVVQYVRDSVPGRPVRAEAGAMEHRVLVLGWTVADVLDGDDLASAAARHARGSGLAAEQLEAAVGPYWQPVEEVWRNMSPSAAVPASSPLVAQPVPVS